MQYFNQVDMIGTSVYKDVVLNAGLSEPPLNKKFFLNLLGQNLPNDGFT